MVISYDFPWFFVCLPEGRKQPRRPAPDPRCTAVEVPINVYPVTWASLPDAQWPEMCHEDSETQGERAFDPFVPWKNWNAGELVTICHHIDLII